MTFLLVEDFDEYVYRKTRTFIKYTDQCIGSELQVGRHSGGVFSISCNLKVFCAFSLGSPHRGDSEEHTQYTIFNKKVTLHHPIAVGAINVRAAEDLLHIHTNFRFATDT